MDLRPQFSDVRILEGRAGDVDFVLVVLCMQGCIYVDGRGGVDAPMKKAVIMISFSPYTHPYSKNLCAYKTSLPP